MCAYRYPRVTTDFESKNEKKIQERISEGDSEINQRIDTSLREEVKPSVSGFVVSRLFR